MMDCKQILSEVSNYLDGDLSKEVKQAVEGHLGKCTRCSLVYSTTRETLRIVSDCGVFTIPVAEGTRLRARLKELFVQG
ncbi:MAG: zf-HC2 domain-containing protein [Acidobacteria bacterium]|nr:zf-HC2 domain-containing protein [Acidobacteriota bacterium]